MQIERIETYPLLYRLQQPYGDANGYKKYRTCYLIRIITRSGVDGWGEIVDWLPTLHKGFVERIVPYLLGKQATAHLPLIDVVGKWHQRAAAGVSMALTEIVAKRAGLSVCELWGGLFHETIPVYASFQSYTDQADWQRRSLQRVMQQAEAGFTQMKVKIGGRAMQVDQAHIELLRASLPATVQLALDANQSYDLSAARKWERVFSRYEDWMWLEEPMPMERVLDYEKLRQSISVAVAGGENLVRCAQYLPLLKHGAVDIIQPDPMHAEGMDGFRANLQLARQFGLRVSPHVFDGSLARLYALFAQACLPPWSKMDAEPVEPVEWDVMENPFTQLFELTPENGRVKIPQGPGIGVEPNWDIINATRWDGSSYT
ncbi:mandelate racemase/muconate lactonizing enzyme family protein [Brevibacillus sp. H7]|uniref:mandelate racemase/muconate lactonizing enzyme family protein n=1 Tax=Brevibacillus sp. H7 TaxID=3349138 RepID=UPI00382E3B87